MKGFSATSSFTASSWFSTDSACMKTLERLIAGDYMTFDFFCKPLGPSCNSLDALWPWSTFTASGPAAPWAWRRPGPCPWQTCTLYSPQWFSPSSAALWREKTERRRGRLDAMVSWRRSSSEEENSPSIFCWNSSSGRRMTSTNSGEMIKAHKMFLHDRD